RRRHRRRRGHDGGVGGGGIAGRVVGGEAEGVGGARRAAPPGVGGGVGAGLGEPYPVGPVGGPVELEAGLVHRVVGPAQVDAAASDGDGRQVARRRRWRRRRGGGGVGGGRFAARVVGADIEGVGGARRAAPPGIGGDVRAGR